MSLLHVLPIDPAQGNCCCIGTKEKPERQRGRDFEFCKRILNVWYIHFLTRISDIMVSMTFVYPIRIVFNKKDMDKVCLLGTNTDKVLFFVNKYEYEDASYRLQP